MNAEREFVMPQRTLPLTERQEQLRRFIKSRPRSPSYSEMLRHMGLHSKSGVARLLEGLEARGFVYRLPSRARAVVALNPVDLAAYSTEALRDELARRGAL